MANFSIDGRMKDLPDIQRQYNFELLIPQIGDWNQDDMIVRCKTAAIPSRGNTPIESIFMGMKQFYPGQPLFTNTLAVEIEEHEDQKALIALHSWNEQIFDTNPKSATAGQAQQSGKKDISGDIKLVMYGFGGDPLPKAIVFKNAFLENVDDSTLGFANNESVKFTATFRFDYWLLQDN